MTMTMNSGSLTTAELFCGAGGFRAGLPDGWQNLWAIDINPHSITTYSLNSGDKCLLADIREIDFRGLPSPDVLTFGFPCNEFSKGNPQRFDKSPDELLATGDYASLWQECVRALDVLQPAVFIAENVPGLKRAGMADVIAKQFSEAGYQVSMAVLNAADYGAPQQRRRLIYGGIRNSLGTDWQPPEPTHQPDDYITIWQAIGDMSGCSAANNHQIYPPSSQCQRAWHKTELGRQPPDELMQSYRVTSGYKLSPDNLSPAIVASQHTCIWHWSEPRAITAREAARLQTFPDDWIFYGGRQAVWSQIGMAVPPVLAAALYGSAEAVLAGRLLEVAV